MNQDLVVYISKYFSKPSTKTFPKIIVFDLDETLGSFSLLHVLWNGLKQVRKQSMSEIDEQQFFNQLLDLYPEFLRYGILHILNFLHNKKKQGHIHKIYIYTNNTCNPPWVNLISNYFTYKVVSSISNDQTSPLFDKTICSFKINNKIIEFDRTTQEKTYNDLINCILLPKTTEICFIDNTYHEHMNCEKVYYIQPRAYIHHLHPTTMLKRLFVSPVLQSYQHIFDKVESLQDYLNDWVSYHKSYFDFKVYRWNYDDNDIFISQRLMYHLRDFIYTNLKKSKTRKRKTRLGKMTRKIKSI